MRLLMNRYAASPAGVPRARSRVASSSDTSARWVASSGTIRIGRPQLTTIRAASGSSQMLNSADAVAFPWSWAPPMITISGIRSTIRGSFWIAIAMFVSGPTGTSVMSPSEAR